MTWRRSRVQISASPLVKFSNVDIENFLDILELSGVTSKHKKEVKRTLKNYSKHILFKLDKAKSLMYFKKIKDNCSIAYYKKQMYQIRKFLSYMKIDWLDDIKLPKDPEYSPKKVTSEDILKTINYFQNKDGFKRFRSLILLEYTSWIESRRTIHLDDQ